MDDEAAAAACLGVGNADDGSGQPMDENDLDDDSSPVPGRSFDQDMLIAVHEAGHAVAARLLGHEVGGATVNPGPGYRRSKW
jgi:hypothetical protein